MGCRSTDNFIRFPKYHVSHLKVSEQGIAKLAQCGITVSQLADAIPQSDVVMLALPDIFTRRISSQIIPPMSAGALVRTLDLAAPITL